MTKQQCEQALLKLMEIAMDVYKMYNPNGNHLSMFSIGGSCSVNDFDGNRPDQINAVRLKSHGDTDDIMDGGEQE